MSFDLINTVGDTAKKASEKALEIFGYGVIVALVILFGDRILDFAANAMTVGLEFILSILAAV